MVWTLSVTASITVTEQITEPDQVPNGLGSDRALNLFLSLFRPAYSPQELAYLFLTPPLTVMSLSDLLKVRRDLPKRCCAHILIVRVGTIAFLERFIWIHRHSLQVHLKVLRALLIHLWRIIRRLGQIWDQSLADTTQRATTSFGLRPVIASGAALALRFR